MRSATWLGLILCSVGCSDSGSTPDASSIDAQAIDTVPADAAAITITGEARCLAGTGATITDGMATVTPDASGRFALTMPPGTAYTISIVQQPTAPAQTCTVRSGASGVAAANSEPVVITCSGTPRYWLAYPAMGMGPTGLPEARVTVVTLDASYCPGVPTDVGVVHGALSWEGGAPTHDRRHLVYRQTSDQRSVLAAVELMTSPTPTTMILADEPSSGAGSTWRMAPSGRRVAWDVSGGGVSILDVDQLPSVSPPRHLPDASELVWSMWSLDGNRLAHLGANRGGYVTSIDATGVATSRAINRPYPSGSCEGAWINPGGTFAACPPTLFTAGNVWGLDLQTPTSVPVDLGTTGVATFGPSGIMPFTPDGRGLLLRSRTDVRWIPFIDGVPQPSVSLLPPGLPVQQVEAAMNADGSFVVIRGQFAHSHSEAYVVDLRGAVPGPAIHLDPTIGSPEELDVLSAGFELDGTVLSYSIIHSLTDIATYWLELPSLTPLVVPVSASADWLAVEWRRRGPQFGAMTRRFDLTQPSWPLSDLGYAAAPTWTTTQLNPVGTYQDPNSLTVWIDDSPATAFTARRGEGPPELYVADPSGRFGAQLIGPVLGLGVEIFPAATP
jgi:hypothetical protein